MLKKILLLMSFVLLLFGTTVFADTGTGHSCTEYKYTYKLKYTNSSGELIDFFTCSDSPGRFSRANGKLTYTFDNDGKSVPYHYSYNNMKIMDSVMTTTAYTNIPTTSNLTINGVDVPSGGTFPSGVIPPKIAPTTEKAITGIVPQLLGQLKEYLPTGVLLLAIILGVSLVPRLVHLFL